MSKQIIVNLHTNIYEDSENDDVLSEYNANKKLLDVVTFYKNKITEFYQNRTWDKYKKLTNEYEMIFSSPNGTTNISKYIPVSRSFFKLWEILHDFKSDFSCMESNSIKCMFLAEGPGGFAEAMMKYRQDYHDNKYHNDTYYGITLKASNKSIPDWKYKNSKLNILYGKDGTGNLYKLENIHHMKDVCGINSFDFITADGGFDFSSDFNNQEDMSLRLLTCEIYSALLLQKEGGTFIIKVFDLFSEYTLHLINLLSSCYKDVKLVKPLTSRPANSEKYLICNNFVSCSYDVLNTLETIIKSEWSDVGISQNHLHLINNISIKSVFIKNLVLFNTFYISRQIKYIKKTIDCINKFTNGMDNDYMKNIIDKHIEKVKIWCTKYNIPT